MAQSAPRGGQPETDQTVSRRRFFTWVTVGASGAIAVIAGVPFVGYLLGPLLNMGANEWLDLGAVDSFPIGVTREAEFSDPSSLPWAGQTAQTGVWVQRRGEEEFTVFALNCTHLGCPVNWLAGAELFLCPCHGGVYYADGSVAGGPPPRPLVRYSIRIFDSQRVQVLTKPLQQTIAQG